MALSKVPNIFFNDATHGVEIGLETEKTNPALADAVLDMVMGTFESKTDEIYGVRVKPYVAILAVLIRTARCGTPDTFLVPDFWPETWMSVFIDAGFVVKADDYKYILTPLGKRAIVAYHLTTSY